MSEEDLSQEVPQEAPAADVSSPAQEPAQEAAPQQEQVDYWGHFKGLPEFSGKDDRDIAAHLYQTMERERAASQQLTQYQQVLPYAQEWMANRREFEAWRQSQQEQQKPVEEVKKSWQPPELKDSYRRYLTKDENGRDVISEDAPLDARQALIEHMNYRSDFAQKFLDNPEEALGPMIQELAQKQAQEIVQNVMTTKENEAFVEQVERENADWLRDSETGEVTPEGFLVHRYIEQARDLGINGPKARWDYGVAMAERDMLARRYQEEEQRSEQFAEQLTRPMETPPEPQPEPAPSPQKDTANENMEYLRREASRNPSRSSGRGIANGQKPQGQTLTFEQMLQQDLNNKGFI